MRRVLVLALLVAACDGPASTPDAGAPSVDGWPSEADREDATVAVADGGVFDAALAADAAPAPTAPWVVSIGFPDEPAGTVALTIVVGDETSPTVDLSLEFSCDAAATWTPATVGESLLGLVAGPTGSSSTVHWHTLDDVDFHAPRQCAVRATPTDLDGLVGASLIVDAPILDNLREAARRVDHYLVHYGTLSPTVLAIAKRHQLVILDPRSADLTQAQVTALQRGVDPADPADDVIVLCYVSIGEDLRTTNKTDAQMLADPRFVGDGDGPRVDPRGPGSSGESLLGLDPLGEPSTGGAGYASFYLDDNDVYRDGVGDGRPDRNAHFGGAFVNAGDPRWFDVLAQMSLDGPDRLAGLDEMLTDFSGRGLGCDGVFLDTIDTAAPNHFTDAGSSNLSQFEWTAAGFRDFLSRLRDTYPGKVILQNRGLFFLDPRHPQFELSTGAFIDYSLFESFRLDSSSAHEYHPFFYRDNRYNVAPALMAEANRGRGFRALSLGYAEGPSDVMSELTLIGQSTLGLASLLEDIDVAQTSTGFRHYLSDASLTRTNAFVLDHASLEDDAAPVWTSTDNDHDVSYPNPPGEPTPRIGVQQVVAGSRRLTLRWDVALDLHRVRYAIYVQDHPFDFAADPALTGAAREVAVPRMGAGYALGSGPGRYPYEADVEGLTAGVMYFVLVRAFDDSPDANEDDNQLYRTAIPTP